MKKIYLLLSLLIFFNACLSAQTEMETLPDTLLTQEPDWKTQHPTQSIFSLEEKNFVPGRLHDPMQFIQGKVPGLIVAKPGGDPNAVFTLRIRGLNTFNQRAEPLIIVDGLPESSLEAIDIFDISEIRVLKDASSSARYGIRGNNGVIEIETKRGEEEGLNLDYQTSLGVESIEFFWPVATAEEYLSFGGFGTRNEGSDTDWQQEISQIALQHAHQLAFHGKKKNTAFRLSLGYRDL